MQLISKRKGKEWYSLPNGINLGIYTYKKLMPFLISWNNDEISFALESQPQKNKKQKQENKKTKKNSVNRN